MNELPPMSEQAKEYLMEEPSPFSKYEEEKKQFTAGGADPFWRKACIDKFDWVNRLLMNGPK